ncbi:MAG TPA: methyltransferase domain-containing protein [Nitrolancea sp.]
MADASSHAFDGVAPRYDAAFTDQQLGRWLREVVWRELDDAFAAGDRVLDLGCGTGEDARHLAERGVQVIATDASSGMLDVARQKAKLARLADRVSFDRLDLGDVGISGFPIPITGSTPLAGAYSNFGPLNCLSDRRDLATSLARVIRPGGSFIAVVMGPFCPWETVRYAFHGHPRTAIRRFRSGVRSRVGGGVVRVWYPSPRTLRDEFAPAFEHVKTLGVGILLPPSDLGHLIPKAPRFFAATNAFDDRLRTHRPFTWLNDHYLIVFRRRGAE